MRSAPDEGRSAPHLNAKYQKAIAKNNTDGSCLNMTGNCANENLQPETCNPQQISNHQSNLARLSSIALILASASASFFLSSSTTSGLAFCTKRSLPNFFAVDVRKPF